MRARWRFLWLIILNGCLALGSGARAHPPTQQPEREAGKASPSEFPSLLNEAFDYLYEQQDKHHRVFTVFDNRDAAGSHFCPSLWMGDLETIKGEAARGIIDDNWTKGPRPGQRACIRICYPKELARDGKYGWIAIGWQIPDDSPDRKLGFHLSRYCFPDEQVRLVFTLRGETGDEHVEIKKNAEESRQAPRIVRFGKKWQEHSIVLSPEELNQPLTKCFCVAGSRAFNPDGFTFYLDAVRLEFGPKGTALRLRDPHFIPSYLVVRSEQPDYFFQSACFAYDQALAICALVARGKPEDLRRARILADALVYAQNNDRKSDDGRIRNAYPKADLAGLGRQGLVGPAHLPGRWDCQQKKWLEDEYFVSSDCGNMAWCIIALLSFSKAAKEDENSPYHQAAERMANWIDRNAFSKEGPGGFTGGLVGFDQKQARAGWKSTEHSIDLYCAMSRLARATGKERYRVCAEHARRFVERMRNPRAGHLWTGTEKDGTTVNPSPTPLDVNTWSLLSLRDPARYGPAVQWAHTHCRVAKCPGDGISSGYDFDTDLDGVWWEGTGQMAVAFRLLGRDAEADACLSEIRRGAAPVRPRGAINAASRDGLTTGFTNQWGKWLYYRRPHVAATCWYIFAELGWNPYYGEPVTASKQVPPQPKP